MINTKGLSIAIKELHKTKAIECKAALAKMLAVELAKLASMRIDFMITARSTGAKHNFNILKDSLQKSFNYAQTHDVDLAMACRCVRVRLESDVASYMYGDGYEPLQTILLSIKNDIIDNCNGIYVEYECYCNKVTLEHMRGNK